jgi:hypothetical protein
MRDLTTRLEHDALVIEQRVIAIAADESDRARTLVAEEAAAAAVAAERGQEEAEARGRVREREAGMAAVARLLESVRLLDGATALSEVLDALADAAAREASRAALMVVRNDRLIGWRLSGFGARDAQAKALQLALDEAGVVAAAVRTAQPAGTDGHEAAAPTFAELPRDRMALAVPVIVGGRVVAVVYADGVADGDRTPTTPSDWPEIVELLARHAARCLESLTIRKTVAASTSPRFWGRGPATPPGSIAPAAGEGSTSAPAGAGATAHNGAYADDA